MNIDKKEEKTVKKYWVLILILLIFIGFAFTICFTGKTWERKLDGFEDITFGVRDTNEEDPNLDKSNGGNLHRPTTKPTTNPTTNVGIGSSGDPSPTIDVGGGVPDDPSSTVEPTIEPTIEPTNKPETPTTEPTAMPTFQPTIQPTIEPTIEPTTKPETPTTEPAIQPTAEPTTEPTVEPTSTSSPNADDKEVPITVKGEDRIRITEEKAEWVLEDKELKIFQNSVFNSNKIAPRVSGKYNFSVENLTNINYIYDFDFIAENNYGINLMYKLKRNGYYIVGNSSTWRDVQDLNVNNLLINANTNDVYTLIWKWVDSENDTRIGMEPNAGYKLTISFIYSQKEE